MKVDVTGISTCIGACSRGNAMMQRYRELASMRPEFHRDHLDGHSGWLTARYEIVIKRDAESIWEYIYDPKT